MNIEKIANAWARSERNNANRGKKVHQKGWVTLEQMRKNAAEKQSALAILLVLLIVVLTVLGFLIKGLFSENKFIRIFSAVTLLAITIGTVIFIRYKSIDDPPETPTAQYFEKNERSVAREPTKHKSDNAKPRSVKTETPISSPINPVTNDDKVVDAPNIQKAQHIEKDEQSVACEHTKGKSPNVPTHLVKTETPNLSPKFQETKADETGETLTELPPPDSSQSQTAPKPQAAMLHKTNPHFDAAKKHDWQARCQKEWHQSFSDIQRTFSIFGGFLLAQPPVDGIDFDTSGYHGSENFQRDVPLRKKYRYFQKADLEFFHGALIGFTLKAHFAKRYSKASIDREYEAFKDDVVKNIKALHRSALGVSVGTTSPFPVRYGESRNPSSHNISGTINTTYYLRQMDDGYDLTLTVNARDGLRRFIELVLKKEADESGDELEDFDKKQCAKDKVSNEGDSSRSHVVRMSKTVKITGFRDYKFGQKYSAARMTAEMWQESGLAIKPVQIRYRKFRTLELGYAIDGKQLCRMRLCAEFPSNTDDSQLSNELKNVKGELEHQLGLEMTERGNEAHYEDENYVVKLWYQSTTKTVYNTRHVGFRNQRVASTVNIKGLYLLMEDKRLMP